MHISLQVKCLLFFLILTQIDTSAQFTSVTQYKIECKSVKLFQILADAGQIGWDVNATENTIFLIEFTSSSWNLDFIIYFVCPRILRHKDIYSLHEYCDATELKDISIYQRLQHSTHTGIQSKS